MPRLLRHLILPLIAVTLLPSTSQAQEATNPDRAADCQTQAQIVTSETPDSLYVSAILAMGYCDMTGPPVLVTRWNSASTGTPAQQALEATTARLRDARLLTALVNLVQNSSASVARRLSAMRVLVRYFDPARDVAPADLLAPDSTKRLRVVFDFATMNGVQPFPSSYRTTITGAMKTVAASAANDQVKKAAGLVRRTLYGLAPASTPLSAEAVGVAYVCGNKFRLRNWDNIPLTLRYRVGESADSGTIDIRPRPEGQQYRELFFTTKTKGTVRVRHLTTLLQTTTNGGTPCD